MASFQPDPDFTELILRPGLVVFDRFRLQTEIGVGGMGVVWRARDETMGHDVALKFLHSHVRRDPEAVSDLKNETKLCFRLTHAKIVRVYYFWENTHAAAIAMEFVPGSNLADLKVRRPTGCFDVGDLTPWIRQLGVALDYAHHEAQVVHRDLKPANLIVSPEGSLKVMDFGISRCSSNVTSRKTGVPAVSGTLVYMSPQQLRGDPATPRDDVYSLGATLYDLLTGKPPFFTGDLMAQISSVPPAPLEQRRAELRKSGAPIPPQWQEVILRCLAKEPGQRPGSAGEVAELLLGSSGGSKSPNRALVAVMSTDVVNYDEILRRAERETIARLKADLARIRAICIEHGGVEANSAGDALLVRFSSAVSSLECALQIQTEFNERREREPSSLVHRIGIHASDVFQQDGSDILGEGVNQAARIQSVASPGAICISDSLHSIVKGKVPMRAEFGGDTIIKKTPVTVWHVYPPDYESMPGPAPLVGPPRRPSVRARFLGVALGTGVVVAGIVFALLDQIERRQNEAHAQAIADLAERSAGWQKSASTVLLAQISRINDDTPAARVGGVEQAVVKFLAWAKPPLSDQVQSRWEAARKAWRAAADVPKSAVLIRTGGVAAQVMLPGYDSVRGPVALFRTVRVGEYQLQITAPGYEDWVGHIEVVEGRMTEMDVVPKRHTGILKVTTQPGAYDFSVVAAGVVKTGRSGDDGLMLPTGTYELSVVRPGFPRATRTIEIRRGEERAEVVDVAGGAVTIDTVPPGASVSRDTMLGQTPYTEIDVAPGRQLFALRKRGYRPATVVLDVLAGKTETRRVSLEKIPPPDGIGKERTIMLAPNVPLEMRWIPPGELRNATESPNVSAVGENGSEGTTVLMTEGFWMGKTEVTQLQWRTLMDGSPSVFRGDGDLPVESVNHSAAEQFCERLTVVQRNQKRLPEGYAYMLPTEAQWEYAYRGGTTGVPDERLGDVAWLTENSERQTHRVAQKRANPWGLHDMLGNVWEWCADGRTSPRTPSTQGQPSDEFFAVRGGGWDLPMAELSASRRQEHHAGRADYNIGFRVVLTLVP